MKRALIFDCAETGCDRRLRAGGHDRGGRRRLRTRGAGEADVLPGRQADPRLALLRVSLRRRDRALRAARLQGRVPAPGAIAAAVKSRAMPPWHADSRVRRYLYDPSLTNGQIDTITRWAARRAPRGEASRPGPALPSVSPRLTRVDVRTPMPAAYARSAGRAATTIGASSFPGRLTGRPTSPASTCAPAGQARFTTSSSTSPRREAPGCSQAGNRQDARPGYGCYGGPSATGRQGLRFQFLAGWVPGSFGSDFARGTGIQVAPGSRLVLQVHYNLESVKTVRPDRSTVELKLDSSVERRAVYAPFVDAGWVLSPRSFAIPPGGSGSGTRSWASRASCSGSSPAWTSRTASGSTRCCRTCTSSAWRPE